MNTHKPSSPLYRSVFSFFLFFSLLIRSSFAKTVSGSVQLSGLNSEAVLASFAISPYGKGWMGISLTSNKMYENERFLKVHLYQDTNWAKFQKELLCTDKAQHAVQSVGLEFVQEDSKNYKAHFGLPLNQESESRTHVWYIVLDDCSLEQRYMDNRIPRLQYELQLWNDVGGNVYVTPEGGGANAEMEQEKVVTLTHVPGDEVGLSVIHVSTLLVSLAIAGWMGVQIVASMRAKSKTVHAALFLVMVAALFDGLSAICRYIHFKRYESNGIGFYLLDALSSHFEAMCDSLVAIVLLSIASGWTLPSDAIHMSSDNSTYVQKLVGGMRNPAGALVSLSPAGWLALLILASHAILAQWGRTYNDDFDSYHELEHLPGRVLMMFRMILGLFMVIASVQTRQNCPPSLQGFYSKLALVGTLWFQSLPFVTWVCSWAVPYYLRHFTVAIWGSVCQSMALILLAWLFTAHSTSSYHKVSRLQNDESLTDQLASSTTSAPSTSTTLKTWKLGKTKIRLD